jgi:hypothetical protein
MSPSAAPYSDGTIRIWWRSGIGCATYELATVAADGTYAPMQPITMEDATMWSVAQETGTTVTYAVRCASSYGLYGSVALSDRT